MTASDTFTSHYEEQIHWQYDCIDRIVLNGTFQLGQSPGGFRYWWRELYGNDGNLTNPAIRTMTGDFARRIYAWSKKQGIPVLHAQKGERKHDLAEPYVRKAEAENRCGVFLIVSGLAPAPVWRVEHNASGVIKNLYREKPWPFVKHWHFHIMDKQWGHLIVRVSGYAPYGLQVILNGHEWVKRQLSSHRHSFETDGNFFASGDHRAIRYWCARLMSEKGAGLLEEVASKWVYGSVLPFALSREDQQRTAFEYSWRIYQVEYSRNFLFHSGRVMEEIHNGLIDRNRVRLDVKEVKTIFGVRGRPHQRLRSANEPRGRRDTVFKTVRGLEHNLSVFKLQWAHSTLKIYDKGARLLRIEAVEHNVKKTKCRGRLECWGEITRRLGERVVRFINTMELLDHGMVNAGRFEDLHKPSQRGDRRLAGIHLHTPRMRRAVEALIMLAPQDNGFTRGELVAKVKKLSGGSRYKLREASYDLRKLRGKGAIERIPKTRRYRIHPRKIRELATLLTIREKVIKPLHAKAGSGMNKRIKALTPIDQQYERVRQEMVALMECMNIQAA